MTDLDQAYDALVASGKHLQNIITEAWAEDDGFYLDLAHDAMNEQVVAMYAIRRLQRQRNIADEQRRKSEDISIDSGFYKDYDVRMDDRS